jgi:hypothetical protein
MRNVCGLLRALWLTGATLMMLDGLTTYLALSHVEGAREANPIGVWAIDHFGLAGMCALKGVIGVLCVWRLVRVANRGHRLAVLDRGWRFQRLEPARVMTGARRALWFTAFLMTAVVLNNTVAIVRYS